MKIQQLLEKAYQSSRGLKRLNLMLRLGIPFNHPHRFQIEKIQPGQVMVSVPYIRKNLNHLKGIHACCLATLAEYTCGLTLMTLLKADSYRLIMKNIHVEYKYQAKKSCAALLQIDKDEFEKSVIQVLDQEGVADYTGKVLVKDADGEAVCEATIVWQLKKWDRVKTQV